MADANTAPTAEGNVGNAAPEVKATGLDEAAIAAMIEKAVQAKLNPIAKTLRTIQEPKVPKQEEDSEVTLQNKTLTQQLATLRAEREADKALEKDLIITNHLEKHFGAKGIPPDAIDIAVSFAKSRFGADFSLDSRKTPVYKDASTGDVMNFEGFVAAVITQPGIGRLLPPVQAPTARGLKGNSASLGRQPKFEELSRSETDKMSTLEISQYVQQHG